MRKSLVDILVDPVSKLPMRLQIVDETDRGEILKGLLASKDNRTFPITKGIPRFVVTGDHGQKQVAESFGFKWQQRGSYEYAQFGTWYHEWLLARYGFANDSELRAYFQARRRILEVGCGSGMSSTLSLSGAGREQEWVGMDISVAVDVARERLSHVPNTDFVQGDILQLPFREGTFDTIFAEGVLHHTPSTEQALKSLAPLLESGGEILFYVYRKKGPIREFTDDYVRGIVSGLPPQDAWDVMRPLTKLGQALAELHAEVEVPEDIPYLGIRAGRYDVQRLIYWHFAKMFWNDAYSFEGNNHVNFDWYHPQYAHRHTEDEIRGWCADAGLSIHYFDAQESGFTVRAIKG
jgi:arsenite methyltransferase